MSKYALLTEIINYLQRQKALGKKKVFRTIIYAVMEDRVGAAAIGTGIAMSKEVMVHAAEATGGVYLSEEGRARIIYP